MLLQKCVSCNLFKQKDQFGVWKRKHKGKCKYCLLREGRLLETNKKIRAVQYKGGCCILCGFNHWISALQFHHIDPSQKDADWNILRKRAWERIKIELDKCVLVCSNCHYKVHDDLRAGINPFSQVMSVISVCSINTVKLPAYRSCLLNRIP